MNYLTREERREVILKAAMQVALNGGLSAMTVRHIATVAGVASGQVHHHFASIGELKALAFVRLIREMLDMPLVSDDASWYERLFSMVGSDDRRLEPYIRLWREAQLLADSDSDIKGAYLLTMDMWHQETVNLILLGTQANEFRPIDNADDIAWRLIALVCGLDGIYALGMAEISDEIFTRYIKHYISIELNPA
ncbi:MULTISPECIES: TetR family transcriptional regulator [Enterobacteriaceae]|mgnify:CR=1 FL=1|uniref:TetR family transcriptional regulator n=1 Tax=Kluyvera genomosp. 2 TaxID=2774054 RepID=A0A2T2Y2J3_9ENTR|nr:MULTISPECIES: TetR family transcriptional regulator [Enterobacteriaceae]HAT3918458.1 TetR family transcriptional regulator [Kluyvera ascorbata]PSR46764.1 TetR family transcriptional regulator [Kluyvera genomosp. 2]BBQ83845.1 TetR family transcriptional regulator [Klebsiella sp. WP3-W18-ESBL-02]BBR20809.1 TetR family transcriptional regulator [Klebsiella sp. WP3-S18-ESBL-05]BBR58979.1 TetR family transcriptional regulator [Klebsiella sp. WP4-W18-ESBL-05]